MVYCLALFVPFALLPRSTKSRLQKPILFQYLKTPFQVLKKYQPPLNTFLIPKPADSGTEKVLGIGTPAKTKAVPKETALSSEVIVLSVASTLYCNGIVTRQLRKFLLRNSKS